MYPPWGFQRSRRNTPPKHPYLMHTTSLLDLNDHSSWDWRDRCSSPTDSSSSSATQVMTPTTSHMALSESRSSTPTPGSTPPSVFDPNFTVKELRTNNPWRTARRAQYSPPVSPKSGSSYHTPRSESRATTPVAPVSPQPTRSFTVEHAPEPIRHVSQRMKPTSPPATPISPVSGRHDDDEVLPEQQITPALSLELKYVPRILTKRGWPNHDARWAYLWAIRQPKTALLLWMCNDLQAWTQAQFWQLKDSQIPFAESDLKGIAADPQKVVQTQWKVILRRLPRDGSHIEFQLHEPIPLDVGGVVAESSRKSESMARVRFLDSNDHQIYVRKRFEIGADRHQDKEAILAKLRSYNRLEHDNIAKIIASYARGQVVAYITPYANRNLHDYLAEVNDPLSVAETLLSWASDLCSALAYLHKKNTTHQSIRPQKILIDTTSGQICFAPFDISPPVRTSAYASYLHRPYSDDPRYMYASPETISERMITQASDVYSLGACLLDIIGVVKGHSIEKAARVRSALSSDLSFHANPDRIHSWIRTLWVTKPSASRNTEAPTEVAALDARANQFLKVIRLMLVPEPEKRKTMRKIVDFLAGTSDRQGITRSGRQPRVRSRSVDLASPEKGSLSMRRIIPSRTNTAAEDAFPSALLTMKHPSTALISSSPEEITIAAEVPISAPIPRRRNALITEEISPYPRESAIWDLRGLQDFYKNEAEITANTNSINTFDMSTPALADEANFHGRAAPYSAHTAFYDDDGYYDDT